MSYQVTGFGAFTIDDQKNVCLANEASGAYWDDTVNFCRGMTLDANRMMCEASGGRWDVSIGGCTCPPDWSSWPSAGLTGCQASTSRLPIKTARITSTLPGIMARKIRSDSVPDVPLIDSPYDPASDQMVAPGGSGFPWLWVIGGVAAVGLIGAGVYYATR